MSNKQKSEEASISLSKAIEKSTVALTCNI